MCIFAYIIIKEPWATPNRATPKSCYPFKKKLKNNFFKKNIPKNQSKNSKIKSKQKKQKKQKKSFI